MNKIL